jgi:hypothetical protein
LAVRGPGDPAPLLSPSLQERERETGQSEWGEDEVDDKDEDRDEDRDEDDSRVTGRQRG